MPSPFTPPTIPAAGTGTQLAYAEITAPVTVSATAENAPNDVVSSGAVTYAATRIRIEFFVPRVDVGATAGSFVILNLWDANTEIGRMAVIAHSALTFAPSTPVYAVRYLTPTAASHTYKARAWRVNSDGSVAAGDGTAGQDHPAFIRVSDAAT